MHEAAQSPKQSLIGQALHNKQASNTLDRLTDLLPTSME
jgi:hypothetical protein